MKIGQAQNRIVYPEITAAISGPSASRLLDLYANLLAAYRKYVMELEKDRGRRDPCA